MVFKSSLFDDMATGITRLVSANETVNWLSTGHIKWMDDRHGSCFRLYFYMLSIVAIPES